MNNGLKISFFGSSLVSAYWNGAATYYRGIIKTLYQLGHHVTFYEPDIFDRQANRDMADPYYAKMVVYQPIKEEMEKCLHKAETSDIIIKASGVGIFDQELEEEIVARKKEDQLIIFWDVDSPATLERMLRNETDYFRALVPKYDQIITYGGGKPVENAYKFWGALNCTCIYNAFDPETHHPVPPQDKYKCDLAFLGNRLPDRENRVDEYFFDVARSMPDKKFILGGSGWEDKDLPDNIKYIGYVPTKDHNVFNSSALAILNISRDSMAIYGYSPAARIFEAAGAGACIITDLWKGISDFLEPDEEILVINSPDDLRELLGLMTKKSTEEIGSAALEKALEKHTYNHRAQQLAEIFQLKTSMA